MNIKIKTFLAFLVIGFYVIDSCMATASNSKVDFIVSNTLDTTYGKVMMLYTLGVANPYCAKLKFRQYDGQVKILHPIDIKSFSRNGRIYESAVIEEKGKDFVFLPLTISGRISYYQVCLNKELGSGYESDQNATAYNSTEYRYFIKKEDGQFESVTKKNFEKIINTYFNDSKYFAFIQNDVKVEYYQISKLVEAYNTEADRDRKIHSSAAHIMQE